MPRNSAVVPNGNSHVPNTCGVGVWSIFRFRQRGYHNWMKPISTARNEGGAGWLIASFTDDPTLGETYHQAYKQLKKRFPIVYQSPVRVNRRTGRQFFFCVYDTNNR